MQSAFLKHSVFPSVTKPNLVSKAHYTLSLILRVFKTSQRNEVHGARHVLETYTH